MVVVQVASSPFFGGPERQMLELAVALPGSHRSVFVLFADRGKSEHFRRQLRDRGLEVLVLARDTPHLSAMVGELTRRLGELGADVLCCHGYKADLVGLLAARRAGVPVVAVSHGWTAATWKVRLYEALDRACLRRMDRVVCVSEGQVAKVRRADVRPDRLTVIRDAVRVGRFEHPDPADRGRLAGLFPHPPGRIVGSAGRLSPEKGFGVLVDAAASVSRSDPEVGFVHFGDGPLRKGLEQQIARLGLKDRFILAGFHDDLDRFLPHWDIAVLPSFTEGLPNVVLESYAAGVPVVATAVGGTPEVVEDGVDGYLVPPRDAAALARRILDMLTRGEERRLMGKRGRERIQARFTFHAQARHYENLFAALTGRTPSAVSACDTARTPQVASPR
jgi:glycosyltransferase involved in cell wall biosynthesis